MAADNQSVRQVMGRVVISIAESSWEQLARASALVQLLDRSELHLLASPPVLADWQRFQQGHQPREQRDGMGARQALSPQHNRPLVHALPTEPAAPRAALEATCRVLRHIQPDVILAGLEPRLGRAAECCRLPIVSLSHHHLLSSLDLSELPLSLRWQARLLRVYVNRVGGMMDRHYTISFVHPAPSSAHGQHQRLGPLTRISLGLQPSRIGEHLLVSFRRPPASHVLAKLNALGPPCFVYGCHPQPGLSKLTFRLAWDSRLVADLVTCRAVISDASNHLVGEALSVGKPIFALPEPGNFDQRLNGWLLDRAGLGRCVGQHHLTLAALEGFMQRLEHYRSRIASHLLAGNRSILRELASWLPAASQAQGREPAIAV